MMNCPRVVGLGLAVGAAIFSLTGLMAEPSDSIDVSSYPPEVQKQHQVFAAKCSRCHDAARALTAKYHGEAQWRDLVDRMSRKPGAGISRKDQAAIASFLVFHEQAAAGGPKPRPVTAASGGKKDDGDASAFPAEMQKRYKVFAEKCSRCHDTSRPLTAKYHGESQWRDLVLRMARKPGAGINRRDVGDITSFLVFHEQQQNGVSSGKVTTAPESDNTAETAPSGASASSTATAGGLRVEAEALPAQPLILPADGQWATESPAEGETILLCVRLYDQATGEKLPYATIRARVGGESGPAAKTLRPLFGDKGFYYGTNFAAPAGELQVSLQVEPPSLGRVHDEGQRWTGPVSFQLTLRGR
jgi:cytochrome c5